MNNSCPHYRSRRGNIVVFAAIMIVPLMAMVAFAIDYGFLLKSRTDLQRAADTAALAAVQQLAPDRDGKQDVAAVYAAVRNYAQANIDASFQVRDEDIEVGRFDPSLIYSNVTLLNNGIADTVRVTLRYDDLANSPISLFFGRVIGQNEAGISVVATAVLQKARYLPSGSDVLPFAVPRPVWDQLDQGDEWTIYGDGKVTDEYGVDLGGSDSGGTSSSGNSKEEGKGNDKNGDGEPNEIPGNWGTVDIGNSNNSTFDLRAQILDGLRQENLDALYQDGRITSKNYIDGGQSMWANADPGLSSGMKSAVQEIHGKSRLIPLYDQLDVKGGNNLEYRISGWGVVEVVDSSWNGAKGTYVKVQKSYLYDGDLRANADLSNTKDIIEGAFTSPVLVE